MIVRKKLTVILSLGLIVFAFGLFIAACGSGGGANSSAGKDTAAAANTAANDKALALIGASDCTTCHKIHQVAGESSQGPAYNLVAAKYSPAADTTIDRLVKKVINGGTGVWGTIPMIGHPALKEADVRVMVQYILSLKS
jgi:cytochrome c551/c552